jgi:hypothetical protein
VGIEGVFVQESTAVDNKKLLHQHAQTHQRSSSPCVLIGSLLCADCRAFPAAAPVCVARAGVPVWCQRG